MEVLVWLVAFLAVAVRGGWRSFRWRSRQRQLMLLCERAGLRFSPVDLDGAAAWMPFRWVLRGNWVGAENVVAYDGDDVHAFDLIVEEWSSRDDVSSPRARYSCAVVPVAGGCPRMLIRPQQPIDGVADALTGAAIDLELDAFNRRFTVRADDRRFAVAFCDQRMMRAIMHVPPGVGIATNEDRLLLFAEELPAPKVLLLLEAARKIAGAVPPVVADLYPPRPSRSPYEDRWLQGRWSPDPVHRGDPGTAAH
jgi:hypothetical protein